MDESTLASGPRRLAHGEHPNRPPAPEAIQTWPPDSGATPLRLPAMSEQEQKLT